MRRIYIGVLLIVGLAFANLGLAHAEERADLRPIVYQGKALLAAGELSAEETAELDKQIVKLIKQEIHALQIMVTRWSINQPGAEREADTFPHSINQLFFGSWQDAEPGLYPNPVTATSADEYCAQQVPFGCTAQSPGNFSCLTRYDEAGVVDGYMIIGYGPSLGGDWDLGGDGLPAGSVIIVASGNLDWSQELELYDNGRLVKLRMAKLE